MEQVIQVLQRWLNPAGLERLSKKIGISIPVYVIVNSLVTSLIPVGGDLVYEYISKNFNDFIKKPASQIVSDLKKSGNQFKWVEDFKIKLWGQEITLNTKTPEDEPKYAIIGGLALIGLLIFMRK